MMHSQADELRHSVTLGLAEKNAETLNLIDDRNLDDELLNNQSEHNTVGCAETVLDRIGSGVGESTPDG